MSVIVLGMDMPKGNAECIEIYIYGDGTVYAYEKKAVNKNRVNAAAKELPPHGRLIDADALLAEAKKLSGPMTGDGWDNWGVYALIERQKTILEAEGEKA